MDMNTGTGTHSQTHYTINISNFTLFMQKSFEQNQFEFEFEFGLMFGSWCEWIYRDGHDGRIAAHYFCQFQNLL